MFTYLLKRLLAMIPTLLGITFVTFLIIDLAPGDPVGMAMGAGGETRSAEGGSSDVAGGSEESRRTKQKLLGEITEDFVARSWSTDLATALATRRTEDEVHAGKALPELQRQGSTAELARFTSALAWHPTAGLIVGTDLGAAYSVGTTGAEIAWTYEAAASQGPTSPGSPITAVAAVPGSPGAAILGDGDGRLVVLNAQTGEPLADAAPPLDTPIYALAALPDATGVLSAGGDGLVRLHTLPSLEVMRTFERHTGAIRALALAADGSRFWTGGSDALLVEWRIGDAAPAREWAVHRQAIRDIAELSGGRIATASADRLIRVIELAGEAEPTTLTGHYKAVTALAYDAAQDVLFSSGDDKTLRAWSVAEQREIARAPLENGKAADLVLDGSGTLWSASQSWRQVPMYVRYWNWLIRVATFDFDRSLVDQRPVMDKIAEALPVTLYLNLISILLIYGISIPLGVMAAVRRGTAFDNITSVVLFLLWSIPNFWLATLLIMQFSSKARWDILPAVGLHSDDAAQMSYLTWLGDSLAHLVLPIVVMTYAGFASLSRYMRTSMLETISQDFIRTARAKGLGERVVIFRHALRNSLITIVTLVGNLLPAMIGGSVIIEYIFTINGMGRLGFNAILARDYPVIMAVTTFGALLTLLGILLSDLLYGIVDPRISHD